MTAVRMDESGELDQLALWIAAVRKKTSYISDTTRTFLDRYVKVGKAEKALILSEVLQNASSPITFYEHANCKELSKILESLSHEELDLVIAAIRKRANGESNKMRIFLHHYKLTRGEAGKTRILREILLSAYQSRPGDAPCDLENSFYDNDFGQLYELLESLSHEELSKLELGASESFGKLSHAFVNKYNVMSGHCKYVYMFAKIDLLKSLHREEVDLDLSLAEKCTHYITHHQKYQDDLSERRHYLYQQPENKAETAKGIEALYYARTTQVEFAESELALSLTVREAMEMLKKTKGLNPYRLRKSIEVNEQRKLSKKYQNECESVFSRRSVKAKALKNDALATCALFAYYQFKGKDFRLIISLAIQVLLLTRHHSSGPQCYPNYPSDPLLKEKFILAKEFLKEQASLNGAHSKLAACGVNIADKLKENSLGSTDAKDNYNHDQVVLQSLFGETYLNEWPAFQAGLHDAYGKERMYAGQLVDMSKSDSTVSTLSSEKKSSAKPTTASEFVDVSCGSASAVVPVSQSRKIALPVPSAPLMDVDNRGAMPVSKSNSAIPRQQSAGIQPQSLQYGKVSSPVLGSAPSAPLMDANNQDEMPVSKSNSAMPRQQFASAQLPSAQYGKAPIRSVSERADNKLDASAPASLPAPSAPVRAAVSGPKSSSGIISRLAPNAPASAPANSSNAAVSDAKIPDVKKDQTPKEKFLEECAPFTKRYIESFNGKKTHSQVIKELKLTDDELKLLDEFTDPITCDVADIPVGLDGKMYDLKTILDLLDRDSLVPDTRDKFVARDVGPLRELNDKLDAAIQKIVEARKNAEVSTQANSVSDNKSRVVIGLSN